MSIPNEEYAPFVIKLDALFVKKDSFANLHLQIQCISSYSHHNMMKTCWEHSPDKRPTFADVLGKLEASFGLRPTSGDVYYYAR